MAIIGFLKYSDFITELPHSPGPGGLVRVQDYQRSVVSKNLAPLTHITFFVEAAAQTETDILVCRFITGRTNYFPGQDEDKLNHLEQRNQRARQRLADNLETEGVVTRPGLIAGADESKVETDPTGLWTTDDLKSFEANE